MCSWSHRKTSSATLQRWVLFSQLLRFLYPCRWLETYKAKRSEVNKGIYIPFQEILFHISWEHVSWIDSIKVRYFPAVQLDSNQHSHYDVVSYLKGLVVLFIPNDEKFLGNVGARETNVLKVFTICTALPRNI